MASPHKSDVHIASAQHIIATSTLRQNRTLVCAQSLVQIKYNIKRLQKVTKEFIRRLALLLQVIPHECGHRLSPSPLAS